MRKLPLVLLFYSLCFHGQITFDQSLVNLGNVPEANEIRGDVVVRNQGEKKVFLLRADADRGVKVYTSKKTLQPGDTALLIVSFFPEKAGNFRQDVRLVSSDQDKPYKFGIIGNLQKLAADNSTACYYFGSRTAPVAARTQSPLVIPEQRMPRDVSNKMPDASAQQASVPPTPPQSPPAPPAPPKKKNTTSTALPEDSYKPNNILFLVDVSGSMKDSLKLPLMKTSLHTLIDAVREIDTITFVTYSDTVKVLSEAISGKNKNELHRIVDQLKARGMTKGRTAILISQNVAQKHFISGGNNQIIMASDGKFRFEEEDFDRWKSRQGDKNIILSTVVFGDDKEAMRNLREIARRTKGSFIHIRSREGSNEALLNEVRERSRI